MKLLLLSNSTNFGEPYLEHAKTHIAAFLNNKVNRVLFVPYAGVTIGWDDYAARVAGAYEAIGYGLDPIHKASDARSAVETCEAIAIGGGNTFHLLKTLYDEKLIEPIQKRVRAGAPMMGWSAGSNVAGPTIRTTNDMPIVEPPTFDALGLVPFQINPHFTDERLPNHGGETRTDRIAEFTTANPSVPVVGLREGSALQVENDGIQLIGPKDMLVFENGSPVRTFAPGDDISFLMKPGHTRDG